MRMLILPSCVVRCCFCIVSLELLPPSSIIVGNVDGEDSKGGDEYDIRQDGHESKMSINLPWFSYQR